MKLFFARNFNNILIDIIRGARERGWDVTEDHEDGDFMDADKVVSWNDVESDAVMLIDFLHNLKKPVITVQHGRYGTSKYYPPFNQKIISDKLCVWGIRDKNTLVKAGHPAEKIEVTGTSIFKHLKPRKKHEGTNVVFCPEHWAGEVEEDYLVAKELRKLKGVNIISKLLTGEHEVKLYDNPVFSARNEKGHFEICANLLATTDIVVSIVESTFELMAQYLDIPVVLMKEWKPKAFRDDKRYLNYRRMTSEASKKAKLKNLNKTIIQQLKNPDELKEERALVAIEEGGTDIPKPVERILNVIKYAKTNT